MNRFKNLFASKTILTAIVGGVFSLLAALDIINIGAETQAGIVAALFAIAGFFRYTATEQLVISKPEA